MIVGFEGLGTPRAAARATLKVVANCQRQVARAGDKFDARCGLGEGLIPALVLILEPSWRQGRMIWMGR